MARKSVSGKVTKLPSNFVALVTVGKDTVEVGIPVNVESPEVGDDVTVSFAEDGYAFFSVKPAA